MPDNCRKCPHVDYYETCNDDFVHLDCGYSLTERPIWLKRTRRLPGVIPPPEWCPLRRKDALS